MALGQTHHSLVTKVFHPRRRVSLKKGKASPLPALSASLRHVAPVPLVCGPCLDGRKDTLFVPCWSGWSLGEVTGNIIGWVWGYVIHTLI